VSFDENTSVDRPGTEKLSQERKHTKREMLFWVLPIPGTIHRIKEMWS